MKKILWIDFAQRVKYSVGFRIGKDISPEKADVLIDELEWSYPADSGDEKVEKYVRPYATEDYAHDWEDFEDIDVYIEEDKEKEQ
jgi:hypothetical protein